MSKAPEDLPDELPNKPPTVDEVYELLDEWENVGRINDIRWEDWGKEKRCEYMIFNTNEHRGFRVIWEEGDWWTGERSSTY